MLGEILEIALTLIAIALSFSIMVSWYKGNIDTRGIIEWLYRGYFFSLGMLFAALLFFQITRLFK